MLRSAQQHVKLLGLSLVVGVLAGVSSAVFLESLRWVTDRRVEHDWLLFLLPLGGLVVGLGYHHVGGRASGGSVLIIDEIHDPTAWVPRRMAPMVYLGTMVTHLFGGSAGREGTAVQMSGSLTDGFSRLVRLQRDDRHTLLIAAVSGGFGAVFGVPFAGCVFAYEVQPAGRRRFDAVLPSLAAALVGNAIVRGLDVEHTPLPDLIGLHLSFGLLCKVAVAGVAFGLTSMAFIHLTHAIKHWFARAVAWAPARPLIGGVGIIALTAVVGNHDYLGLSVPLMLTAVAGGGVVAGAFALKLVFTALTLGSGFPGGEVTPLFVIGATLGVSMARLVHAPLPVMAAIGLVAVFAGAANTPVACTVMGLELFGAHVAVAVVFAIGCMVSYACSSRHSIYRSPEHGPRSPSGRVRA